MDDDTLSDDGSVGSTTSYNLRSFCGNKHCTGEGLDYSTRISPSPSSSRAGTPIADLDRSLYSAVNGERRVRRRGHHHHHPHHSHHRHGPGAPIDTSTPAGRSVVIRCELGTLEEEQATPSKVELGPPLLKPSQSVRSRTDSTQSAVSKADSVASKRSRTDSTHSVVSKADSVTSKRSRTDSVKSNRSRKDSVQSNRSRTVSISSVHSEEEKITMSRNVEVTTDANEVDSSVNKNVSNFSPVISLLQVDSIKKNLMGALKSITERSPIQNETTPNRTERNRVGSEYTPPQGYRSNSASPSSFPKYLDFELAPRTGYTYRKSLAYRDTVTPDRIDEPPNMARPSVRMYSPSTSSHEHGYNLRSRSVTPQPVHRPPTPKSESNGPTHQRNNVYKSTTVTTTISEYSDEDDIDFPKLNGGYQTEATHTYSRTVTTWIYSTLTTLVTTILTPLQLLHSTEEATSESSWMSRCWMKVASCLCFWRWDSTRSTSSSEAFWSRFWHREETETESSEDYSASSSSFFTTSLIGAAAIIWFFLNGTARHAWCGLKSMLGLAKSGLYSAAVSVYRLVCWTYLLETWILVQGVAVRQWMWKNRRWLALLLVPLLLFLLGYGSTKAKHVSVDEIVTVHQGVNRRYGGAWKYIKDSFDGAVAYARNKSTDGGRWQLMWKTLYSIHDWFYQFESGNTEEHHNETHRRVEEHKVFDQADQELLASYMSVLKQVKEDEFLRELVDLKRQLRGYLETQEDLGTLKGKLEKLEASQQQWTHVVETLKKKSDEQDETNAEVRQQLHQLLAIDTVIKKHEAMLNNLGAKVEGFQAERKSVKEEGEDDEKRVIREQMEQLKADTVSLEQLLKNCCSDKLLAFNALQDKMNEIWAKLLEQNEKFVSKIEVQQRVDDVMGSLKQKIIGEMEGSTMVVVEKNIDFMSKKLKEDVERKVQIRLEEALGKLVSSDVGQMAKEENSGSIITTEFVNRLIRSALAKYDADKTGMADYALESSGGTVVSTRCTETYTHSSGTYYFFGVPVWRNSISPRSVIQEGVKPGDCWAFKGSRGFLVIQLSATITPTAFSLEHIPKSLSPGNKITSAPRNFSVYGLEYENDPEGVELGNYEYKEDGEPLQYFIVGPQDPGSFVLIEIRVHSNWGNLDFTCMYRFRVHGTPAKH